MKQWISTALSKMKIQKFTPIQERLIPEIEKKQNVIGISPTGSGKTLAFLLPILEKIDLDGGVQTVILVPTRELARQIYSVLQVFHTQQSLLKIHLWIGGNDFQKQVQQAKNIGQIIIATPKRFIEITRAVSIDFRHLQWLVIDETDMLFDLGFFPEIEQIFQQFSVLNTQKIALSATLHDMWAQNLKRYLTNAKVVSLGFENKQIEHSIIWNDDKFHSLSVLINRLNPYLCLIFANTKKQVDEIYDFLQGQGRNVTRIHGDLQTRERKNRYKEIKSLRYQYVVASDLASRGLDIDGASDVISWNLPNDPEWYLHRAGRTGRQKYTGNSYILFSPNEDQAILKKLVGKKIKFHDYIIKNNALVSSKSHIKRRPVNFDQEQEVKQLLVQPKIVKPGYKKKLQAELKRINQKHKRAHLEKVIKAKRIEKYKK